MPSKHRDVGKEIDSAEPSEEVKRAIARDFAENAGKRPIRSSEDDETYSTRRASDDERPGS